MSAAISRRRSGFVGRPQSMIVDSSDFDLESSFFRVAAHSRQSSSATSSALSSIDSASSSNIAFYDDQDQSHSLVPQHAQPSLKQAPSQSQSSSLSSPSTVLPTKHGLSPEKDSKKSVFGRMRLSLDRRRKMPWSNSSKNSSTASITPAPQPPKPKTQRKSSSTSTSNSYASPTSSPTAAPHQGVLQKQQEQLPQAQNEKLQQPQQQQEKEQQPQPKEPESTTPAQAEPQRQQLPTRQLSTRLTFGSIRSSLNPNSGGQISPTIKLVTASPVTENGSSSPSTPGESSLYISTSPSSVSSVSPSPVKSSAMSIDRPVPETIMEDDPVTPTRMPSTTQVPRLRAAPRPRKGPARARPNTIVGFFRQSKAFSAPKICDVFGMTLTEATMATRMSVENDDPRYWVPAIVSICVEFLNKYALEEEGLYRISGSASAVEELKKEFAFCGESTVLRHGVHDVHTVASLLKSYIRQLPEEIVAPSPQLSAILMNRTSNIPFTDLQDYLAKLPPYNYHTLCFLCGHFGKVAGNYKQNRMPLSNLVLILCPTMRMDSKLFSWMVEFTDQCIGDPSRPLVRYSEQISLIEETSRQGLE
ncbi:hypothetical protein BZA70DRAFT_308798 [Myxozyma melibiosi]|uniref:Rho-GAP domain-containing protein n=1 Tax=Myxozyma melibiosi TaxID=54550 RepID=A0ABR1FDW0_9ASCO